MKNNKKENTKRTPFVVYIMLILTLIAAIFYLIYLYQKDKYSHNRELIMSKWQSETGFVIDIHNYSLDDYTPTHETADEDKFSEKYSNVKYDEEIARLQCGYITITNYEELKPLFDITICEDKMDFQIPNEYQLGQKHDLVINTNDIKLFIDDLSPNGFTMSNESGVQLKFSR